MSLSLIFFKVEKIIESTKTKSKSEPEPESSYLPMKIIPAWSLGDICLVRLHVPVYYAVKWGSRICVEVKCTTPWTGF